LGIDAVPLSRQPMAASAWRESPVLGEGDAATWVTAFAGLDAVVHCAARVHVMREEIGDPLAIYRRINRDGALAMAEGAARAGVRRIVFISSVKVLGESTDGGPPFRNDDPVAPLDPYAVSKAEAENALTDLAQQRGFELVVLRPPLVYGPGVGGNVASLANAIRKGVWLPLGSAQNNRRSMISIDNLCSAIEAALIARHINGGRYLVSDGDDMSTRALIEGLAAGIGRKPRLIALPPALLRPLLRLLGREAVWARLFGDLRVDIADSCTRLSWTPAFSTADGLRSVTTLDRSHA
jgi:nucleoside-diphosphate-sugar epimerase